MFEPGQCRGVAGLWARGGAAADVVDVVGTGVPGAVRVPGAVWRPAYDLAFDRFFGRYPLILPDPDKKRKARMASSIQVDVFESL